MGNETDKLRRFYIGGKWVSPVSDMTMPVLDPATEEQIATLALDGPGDDDRAVKQDRLALLQSLMEGDHIGPLFDQIQFDPFRR